MIGELGIADIEAIEKALKIHLSLPNLSVWIRLEPKKNFCLFFTARPVMQAARMPIKTGKADI
jgi:hypothetical protein